MKIEELWNLKKETNLRLTDGIIRYRVVILGDNQTKYFNLNKINNKDNPHIVGNFGKSFYITIYNYDGKLKLKNENQIQLLECLKIDYSKDPFLYRFKKIILGSFYKSKFYEICSNFSLGIYSFFYFLILHIKNNLRKR